MPSIAHAMRVAEFSQPRGEGEIIVNKLRSQDGQSEMITELTIGQSVNDLANALEVSRSALSRWRAGSSVPNFPKFLQLVDLTTGRVLEFLDMFVDPADIPSVSAEWGRSSRLRALANLMPIFLPTLCAIDLSGYKAQDSPDNAWLAARVGCSREEMKYALDRMEDVNAIRFNGTHWEPSDSFFDLYTAGCENWNWLQLETKVKGYVAGTVSRETANRARLEAQNFLHRVDDLIQEDEGWKNEIWFFSFRMARMDKQNNTDS